MNSDWQRRSSRDGFGRRSDRPRSSGPDRTEPGARDTTAPPEADSSEITELEAQVDDLEQRWRQSAADLENAKRRCRRDVEFARESERRNAAEIWLPIVDNLELALAQAEADPDAIIAGVEAVYRQALDVLSDLGYPQDSATGVPFDPTRHEAVAVVPAATHSDGTVVDVVRPGYGTADRLLRPASVMVAKEAS